MAVDGKLKFQQKYDGKHYIYIMSICMCLCKLSCHKLRRAQKTITLYCCMSYRWTIGTDRGESESEMRSNSNDCSGRVTSENS
jgi:hypothetical protein